MFYDEIEPERRDELLDEAAQLVARFEMFTPAILVVDGFRPLSFIASQALHFVAPFANVVTGHPYTSEAAYILQDRENLDRFLDRLEELADESDQDDTDSNNE